MMNKNKLTEYFISRKNPEYAKVRMSFFQTNKGQYSENDIFIGVSREDIQNFVKKYYKELTLNDIQPLIANPYHEIRLTAVHILVKKYKREKDAKAKKDIYDFYMRNLEYINNWDLVDISCWHIVGEYLYRTKGSKTLYTLAKSDNLWERRVAIVSTLYFIKKGDFDIILTLTERLINDQHHLIHKAIGWMLRETGKQNEEVLYRFLDKNAHKLPRTTLRYALEKFTPKKKKLYMTQTTTRIS